MTTSDFQQLVCVRDNLAFVAKEVAALETRESHIKAALKSGDEAGVKKAMADAEALPRRLTRARARYLALSRQLQDTLKKTVAAHRRFIETAARLEYAKFIAAVASFFGSVHAARRQTSSDIIPSVVEINRLQWLKEIPATDTARDLEWSMNLADDFIAHVKKTAPAIGLHLD